MSRCCCRIVDNRWCGCRRSRHRRRKKRKPVLPGNIGEQIDEKQEENVKSNSIHRGSLVPKMRRRPRRVPIGQKDEEQMLMDRKMKKSLKNPSDTKNPFDTGR